jgi:AraC-like DNA-binding protein
MQRAIMSVHESSKQVVSPLLYVLQNQIVPDVRQNGMNNVVVARPTLKGFQAANKQLPDGLYATEKPLVSKRIPVRGKRKYGVNAVTLEARWPEDGLHSSRATILTFAVRGGIAIQLGNYVLHCREGHGIIIPPSTPHPDGSHLCVDELRSPDGICEMLSFKSWGNGVECWLNHTSGGKHWSHRAVGENFHVLHPNVRLYLETLAEEAVAQYPQYRSICGGLLMVLTSLLLREIEESRAFQPLRLNQTSLDPAAPPMLQEQKPISRAQAYVNSHLHENLSIDKVADHVYMSRAHFTRQFRKVTGKTFIAYVNDCRIEKAKVLLQDTEWPIDKISAMVGITSARLRLLFLEHLQNAPSDFRAISRKKTSRT